MESQALQDLIRPYGETCFGCGGANPHGLRIKSYRDGEEVVCTWSPEAHHIAVPGIVNGGIIAALIDCHSACAAMDAACRAEGVTLGSEAAPLYVTASLQVDYLRPTPHGVPLTLRAKVAELSLRKIVMTCSLHAEGKETARGRGVFVRSKNLGAG